MREQPDVSVETTLLGPVLEERSCGDCTVCCTTLRVDAPDFQKPAETPCRHIGQSGCTIHAVRPHICRTWFCAWRRVAAMPEEARPDRSGLLVSISFVREPRNCFEGIAITVRILPDSTAIADGMAARVLDSLCDRFVPVWVSRGAEKMLVHPDNAVAQHVIAGTPAPVHLQDEVREWRLRYGLFASVGADRDG
ncbi:YkgJ family cysteine cluster protein [Sphingomonas sp. KR1UV-12]|uniref:YkgJ family cysteine cluster protein n=1 Tax=Sphingomonas aurea TaxID=3063994 RepID=A0ABT9ELA7_9SPHN|nr:YkgJ family cysteine cluster protein [Sphingomonas sp. KR1UV-12]MDP1027753.1 YkgJ family cysteine cluster protein [Sphingomonas sp. KR1UV-12]